MSTNPEDITKEQKLKLYYLYEQHKICAEIPKPADVEASITPLYNWLEGMFEHPTEDVLV